ncbi:MAG: hypothetical protein FRX48_01460 [Lasallia pustulata]|uniref:Uncharacterized protein n=1 Tax=Lasallia pustulata TaxID=136370 RepID=A0A5M8Q0D8_9LECA|nr:MAG: hypothetical protein FRX48_01460 [Lasallia pustulata]
MNCIRCASIPSQPIQLPNRSLTYLVKAVPDVEIHGPIYIETMHVIPERHDCRAQHAPCRLVVISILGVQFNAVRSQPPKHTIRAGQQSVAHRLNMFGNADKRRIQDLKDLETRNDAGHCEGDEGS